MCASINEWLSEWLVPCQGLTEVEKLNRVSTAIDRMATLEGQSSEPLQPNVRLPLYSRTLLAIHPTVDRSMCGSADNFEERRQRTAASTPPRNLSTFSLPPYKGEYPRSHPCPIDCGIRFDRSSNVACRFSDQNV